MLRQMGIDTLTLSESGKLYWDEATKDLILENLVITVDKLGSLQMDIRFGGVPKALFEDPENQAQLALVMMAFKSAEISFTDSGVVRAGLAQAAEQQGISEEDLIKIIIGQAQAQLGVLGNKEFADMVLNAVETFLVDPDNLKVSLLPANPVPVAQIMGSAATPQIIPGLLNAQISANK